MFRPSTVKHPQKYFNALTVNNIYIKSNLCRQAERALATHLFMAPVL